MYIQLIVTILLLGIFIYYGALAIKNIYKAGSLDCLWSWFLTILIGK